MTFIMPSEIIHKQRTDWDGVLEDLFGIGKCPDDQNRSIEKTVPNHYKATCLYL